MIELVMHGANVEVSTTPDGLTHLLVKDPESGIVLRLSMPADGAKGVANALLGNKVDVFSQVPPGRPRLVH